MVLVNISAKIRLARPHIKQQRMKRFFNPSSLPPRLNALLSRDSPSIHCTFFTLKGQEISLGLFLFYDQQIGGGRGCIGATIFTRNAIRISCLSGSGQLGSEETSVRHPARWSVFLIVIVEVFLNELIPPIRGQLPQYQHSWDTVGQSKTKKEKRVLAAFDYVTIYNYKFASQ